MKYIDEYRDRQKVSELVEMIGRYSGREINLMEVCGGHTMAIRKFGIPALLPPEIRLLSGPGCPVCVTDRHFIDRAIAFSRLEDVVITTFGDLIRVPGSTSSLEKEKAAGRDIRIVYSILDALMVAKNNPHKKVIFLGIGFETTAPGTAAGIVKAQMAVLPNFYVYSSHKVMPPAMAALVEEGIKIDGYIAPGHVSTITGTQIYNNLPEKYGLGCVISGFEPTDILQSVLMLVRQVSEGKPAVEIQYKRAVRPEGNPKALALLEEVFTPSDDWWRGLGVLAGSGMRIREKYAEFDAERNFVVEVEPVREDKGCICGEILKGLKKPVDCKLFGKACHPSDPVGACMVSNEGACHAYYRYGAE